MEQRFVLFVRKLPSKWWAISVLTHPRYALYGRDFDAMKQELTETLSRDLALKHLVCGETHWPDLQLESMPLVVKAVQNGKLVRVPLTFSLVIRTMPTKRVMVTVPRLDLSFSLDEGEDVRAWAEERIRGALHLKSVAALLNYSGSVKERLETLSVKWHGAGKYKAEIRAAQTKKASKAALEDTSHTLGGVATDWVAEAKRGALPRALHRAREVDELVAALCRPKDRSVALVGAPGAGKTALVQELAHRIAQGRVPPKLQDIALWHVTGNRIVAGMRYLGEWQERALTIAKGVERGAGILYVDGLVELLSTGEQRGGLNLGQLLLPFLDRNAFALIAEATPHGVVAAEAIHAPFVRALQPIEVEGLDPERATAVLSILAGRMARERGVRLGDDVLPAVFDVLARFGREEAMPGAGLRLVRKLNQTPRGGLVDAEAVREAFRESSGLPAVLLDPAQQLHEDEVRSWFCSRIVGQPKATERMVQLLLVLKAALSDPSKPLASMLLVGPTGVGKTETAKALASWLFGSSERLIRFDLSEFSGIGSATRLVDGPGGQGLLTQKVREQPFSVLLFDEVEKAEPGVFDVLLAALGEGRLTDGTGHTVSFRHTIVLLTSNLGAGEQPAIGMARSPSSGHFLTAARDFFRPEFLNRLDAVVPFDPLTPGVVEQIAEGMLTAALKREGLVRRGVTVDVGAGVVSWLVKRGFDAQLGARPMKRAIEEHVLVPMARLVASGTHGTQLTLAVVDDQLHVKT